MARGPCLARSAGDGKLQAEAETVAVEVWKWIELTLDLPYGYSHGMLSLSGDPAPMTDDEAAAHAKLLAEYRALEEEYAGQDEIPDEVDTRPLFFDAEEIGRAWAFVTFDRYGALVAYRGYDHLTSDESFENGNTAYKYTYTETVRRFGWHRGGRNPSLAEYPECMYILHKWRPRSCMNFLSSRRPT